MSVRQIFVDQGVGEMRGVVTLDGRPERLLIHRADDDQKLALGARLVARIAAIEPAMSSAFLDLGDGKQAILAFKPDAKPVRGATVEIEIRAEPREGKLAVARWIGTGEGAPRVLSVPPSLQDSLRTLVRDVSIVEGPAARAIADEAAAEALKIVHPLPGGGTLAIEPTRALTAIDVDLGERKGADVKRVSRQANLAALAEAARLLRLKGLGGLVVIDLVGRGHDGNAMLAAARVAFAPDNPGVSIGPVGRFGTMELSIPRRTRPVLERLCQADGSLTDRAIAQRLIRRLEDEAGAQPGARLVATCSPSLASTVEGLVRELGERFGHRFAVVVDGNRPRDQIDVRSA